ncbi:ATP-binding protein [Streptomyces sp. NPDC013157]|uniref:ATP-binding protein n=1 Tax=Streptomyces sp. NPDC013157 TaxID=3364861 RepID=UPI0036A4C709
MTIQKRAVASATFVGAFSAVSCLYRIVQESLTNVVKHATEASKVDIVLLRDPRRVAFTVTDGRPVSGPCPDTRTGNGLTGMREHVALFDGDLTAGPAATGWAVSGELKPSEPR